MLHHLSQRLPDARNCVLLAGFQAEGTRGRALEDGAKSIQIHGEDVPVRAEVVNLRQFSAHARTQRADALARRNSSTAPPDFSGARRASGGPSAGSGGKDRTALECDGGELSAESRASCGMNE